MKLSCRATAIPGIIGVLAGGLGVHRAAVELYGLYEGFTMCYPVLCDRGLKNITFFSGP